MANEITVKELFGHGKITDTEVENLWYDWFCKDKSLVNYGRRLLGRLHKIIKLGRNTVFDPSRCGVSFKNNCPMIGNKYNSLNVYDLESGESKLYLEVDRINRQGERIYSLRTWKDGFTTPVESENFNDILDSIPLMK